MPRKNINVGFVFLFLITILVLSPRLCHAQSITIPNITGISFSKSADDRALAITNSFTMHGMQVQPVNLTLAYDAVGDIFSMYGEITLSFDGNTLSTTLYRFVETAGVQTPLVGIMSGHPHVSRRKPDFDPANPCRHFIRSSAFAKHFGKVDELELFKAVAGYCGAQSGGPLGSCELVLIDDNGDQHRFYFETFFAYWDALTLGVYVKPEIQMVAAA